MRLTSAALAAHRNALGTLSSPIRKKSRLWQSLPLALDSHMGSM